ncbi:unnamed protein product [Phytophthora lilii]|uniref:Unnamed protein product n=1 Tax=Phytophthora lilii TaxID=2077276 RepID=A0A9W6U3P2_9STRA|nr:unnamed protein product [Phytophthora lilii]
MVATGQYKQRAEEALARYIVMLNKALRGYFQASFVQQKQDLKELEEKQGEVKDLIRKHGSTRATRQICIENDIRDIEDGIEDLQRQRIRILWAQQKLWNAHNLEMLTATSKVLLEHCYKDILDMQVKNGDNDPEWDVIQKAWEEVLALSYSEPSSVVDMPHLWTGCVSEGERRHGRGADGLRQS